MRLIALLGMLVSWQAFAQFSNESELAILQTGGNSTVQTYNAKTSSTIKWDKDQVKFGGHYIYGESDSEMSARNWDVNVKYERSLTDHLAVTVGEMVEGNSFVGIRTRYNTDIGAKYYYIKTDKKNFFSELGYRYSLEERYAPQPNTYDNKVRLYNELTHKISETVQYKLWLEFIPNLTQDDDYLINGEASLTAILNSVFSLKVAYLGMYDNRPAKDGYKNYDHTTTTSIVAKF